MSDRERYNNYDPLPDVPGRGRGFGPDDPWADPVAEQEHQSYADELISKARQMNPDWDPQSYARTGDALHDAKRMVGNARQGKGFIDRDRQALKQAARVSDARDALRIQGNLQGAQFGENLHTAAAHEAVVQGKPIPGQPDQPGQHDDPGLGQNPGWIERNFSPKTRARGRLAGAAFVFAASTPPLIPSAYSADIRY